MRRAPARPVRACFVRSCCSVAVQEHDLRATPVECKHFPHTSHCTKIEKICWQITFAALMQPFQYDLRSSAAKDNSITHAAAAPSNLDAATTMRSAETELQNTIELRAMASEIAAPKPDDLDAKATKRRFWSTLKGILKGKLLAPKLRKSADKSLSQPWCSRSNTIYDLQLQKTIVLRMQPQHRATLTQPLQCVSQHPVANLHLSTDVATSNDDNEAAIPMQSATRDSRTAWNYAHRHNHSLQNT